MADITWIIEDQLAAMSRPLFEEDFEALRERGIDTLVSLTEVPPDLRRLESLGVEVHRLPIPDMSVTSMKEMDRAVERIDRDILKGKKVAVHCGAGLGRTGLVIACYLVSVGDSGDGAIRRVRRHRPGAIETAEQETYVHQYALRRERGSR